MTANEKKENYQMMSIKRKKNEKNELMDRFAPSSLDQVEKVESDATETEAAAKASNVDDVMESAELVPAQVKPHKPRTHQN